VRVRVRVCVVRRLATAVAASSSQRCEEAPTTDPQQPVAGGALKESTMRIKSKKRKIYERISKSRF